MNPRTDDTECLELSLFTVGNLKISRGLLIKENRRNGHQSGLPLDAGEGLRAVGRGVGNSSVILHR